MRAYNTISIQIAKFKYRQYQLRAVSLNFNAHQNYQLCGMYSCYKHAVTSFHVHSEITHKMRAYPLVMMTPHMTSRVMDLPHNFHIKGVPCRTDMSFVLWRGHCKNTFCTLVYVRMY